MQRFAYLSLLLTEFIILLGFNYSQRQASLRIEGTPLLPSVIARAASCVLRTTLFYSKWSRGTGPFIKGVSGVTIAVDFSVCFYVWCFKFPKMRGQTVLSLLVRGNTSSQLSGPQGLIKERGWAAFRCCESLLFFCFFFSSFHQSLHTHTPTHTLIC